MKELIENIQSTIESFQTDANLQVESGNKAAGTRARKSSLALEKLLKEFRKVSVAESKK
ncbi:histone H1 [Winogradskyella wichelsiae]|uniref:histone H1 n=1 Tax=Winogradskyella wichelsiae TaxID=2697007 RepID=UPI0015CB2232|nr:histone H1 [Winogradskyella wichelsiae]